MIELHHLSRQTDEGGDLHRLACIAHAAIAEASGGRCVAAIGWSPNDRRVTVSLETLCDAVGVRYVFRDVTQLIAIANGCQLWVATCEMDGRHLRFDCWWPHLGIAVDTRALSDEEIDRKRGWCTERAVMYFALDDLKDDLAALKRYAAERRRILGIGSIEAKAA